MGDQMFEDVFEQLHETKHAAYEAGKFQGASNAIAIAREAVSHLSVKYETTDVAKFHAIEEACASLRRLAERINIERERDLAGGNH